MEQETNRRTGRTTRIVDGLVHDYFTIGVAVCYDHFMSGSKPDYERLVKNNLDRVVNRLRFEHGVHEKVHYRIEKKFIIKKI